MRNSNNIQVELHGLLLAHQQRLAKFTARQNPGLNALTALTLSEMAAEPGISAAHISRVLNLDRTKLSRLVSELNELKLIKVKPGRRDRRQKELFLTSLGKQRLNANHLALTRGMKQCFEPLSKLEQERIGEWFQKFADSLSAPRLARPADLPALMVELRRLSQVVGFVADNFLDSGLSSIDYQVLRFLNAAEYSRAKDIVNELELTPTMVSRSLAKLEQAEFISFHEDEQDGRNVRLKAKPDGIRLLEQIDSKGAALLSAALSKIPDGDPKEFRDLLLKYLYEDIAVRESVRLGKLSLRHLPGPDDVRKARAFYITELVQRGMAEEVPEEIFPAFSTAVTFYLFGRQVGVCEVLWFNQAPRIRHAYFTPEIYADYSRSELDSAALELATKHQVPEKVIMV